MNSDFLDSKGQYPNFLNSSTYSDQYREEAKRWSQFPMYTEVGLVDEIVESIRHVNVTLVISGTGSGKTVLLPKIASKILMPGKIAVTNPKTATTLENVKYAARCMDVELGNEVGYQYRGAPKGSHVDNTRLMYQTDGMLLAKSRRDPLLLDYACVIIDEAHERNPSIDFLLQASLNILKERSAFRLVVMSATIDASLFENYFKSNGIDIKTIHAKGVKSYPVKHHYMLDDVFNPTKDIQIDDLVKRWDYYFGQNEQSSKRGREKIWLDDQGDILYFIPTTKDALGGCKKFNEACNQGQPCATMLCAPLFSKAKDEDKRIVIDPLGDDSGYVRKLIFATNIAESSFTFKNLKYVIDTGKELESRWNPSTRSQTITKKFTSQAQLVQREGRVGRVDKGDVYHLYSEKFRKTLEKFPDPSILLMDVTQELIAMMSLSSYSTTLSQALKSFGELLTPPSKEQVTSAVLFLRVLNLVEKRQVRKTQRKSLGHGESLGLESLGHGKSLLLLENPLEIEKLSSVGRLVQDAIAGGMLSPWTAYLFVVGSILKVEESFALATILEAISADSSIMWRDQVGELSRDLVHRTGDHETLMNIYRYSLDPLVDSRKFDKKTGGMSWGFWKSIHERIDQRRSRNLIKDVKRRLEREKNSPAVVEIRRRLGNFTKVKNSIAMVVLISRSYHSFVYDKKGSRVAFSGLKPLSIRVETLFGKKKVQDGMRGVAESFVTVNKETIAQLVTLV